MAHTNSGTSLSLKKDANSVPRGVDAPRAHDASEMSRHEKARLARFPFDEASEVVRFSETGSKTVVAGVRGGQGESFPGRGIVLPGENGPEACRTTLGMWPALRRGRGGRVYALCSRPP